MPVTFKNLGSLGRLGNQMWQGAVTISHALANDDIPLLPEGDLKKYFNIPTDWFGDCSGLNFKTYEEPHFHFEKIKYWENQNLNGYFQSYKYLEPFKDQIKKWFTPKDYESKESEMTAVHVRRGDYLSLHNCYEILTRENYYDKAMEFLPGPYLIFSDDITWCKNVFIGDQFIFSEGKSFIDDFISMMSCTNFIIANSSYSYWAAYLSNNPSKKVVAPSKWFGPKLSVTHNTKDLYLPEWLLV